MKVISIVSWCTKQTDWHRNTSDLLKIVEDLHKQNVEFFSLSERMEVNTSSENSCYKYLRVSQNLNVITLSRTYSWAKPDVPKKAIIRKFTARL